MRPALACLAAVALASCATPPREYRYDLNVSVSPSEARIPATLVVKDLKVAAYCAPQQMTYRTSPVDFAHYHYHMWAAPPGILVQDALILGLRRAGVFKGVWEYGRVRNTDYALTGNLWRFEELDLASRWEVRLVLDLYVEATDTGAVVYERRFDLRAPAPKRNPAGVAEAMSQHVGEVIRELVADLPDVLAPRE